MFFELSTGEVVAATAKPSVHCAGDHIHFWGDFSWSFSPSFNDIWTFNCLIQNSLPQSGDAVSEESDNFCFHIEHDMDEYTVFIDDKYSRFNFQIPQENLPKLAQFLKDNFEERAWQKLKSANHKK